MALVDFRSQLKAAGSLLALAQILGEACMDKAAELKQMQAAPQTKRERKRIELHAAAVSFSDWEAAIADPASMESRLGTELVALLESAKMRQPLDFYAVLLGLCRRPLTEIYRFTTGTVQLDRGMPVLFPERRELKFETTTSLETRHRGGLLHPHGYLLFPHPARDRVRIALDFGHRNQIDELTWSKEGGFAKIATIHPKDGDAIEFSSYNGHFFDVRPERWEPGSVLRLLASVADEVSVAVLPELSLPTPGELGAALAENPPAYPPIVVAGSAHVRQEDDGEAVRSNESWIYIEGKRAAVAYKYFPYVETKEIGGEALDHPLAEDLTDEPKTITVLAGTHTRLAVVICADAIEPRIPDLLVDAGVNHLVVPAMTRKTGSFGTPLGQIAGYCQGVGAIANACLDEDGKPFLCFAAVPRPQPKEQLASLSGNGPPPPQVAIFDPNQPLPGAVIWR